VLGNNMPSVMRPSTMAVCRAFLPVPGLGVVSCLRAIGEMSREEEGVVCVCGSYRVAYWRLCR
jgi:hypothetical protein